MRAKHIILMVAFILVLLMPIVYIAGASTENSDGGKSLDASASSSATGTETHVDASAKYSDDKGRVTATTEAKASGDSITLSSRASAQGANVHGKGSASVTGKETSSKIDVIVDKISEGIIRVTVIVSAFANGNAHGETYASAWADNGGNGDGNNDNGDGNNGDGNNGDGNNGDGNNGNSGNVVKYKVEENPAFRGGFTFGKNDAERYYHFKHQVEVNCEENGNKTCARAKYFISVILNDHGANATDFELKYPLEDVIKANPSLVEE